MLLVVTVGKSRKCRRCTCKPRKQQWYRYNVNLHIFIYLFAVSVIRFADTGWPTRQTWYVNTCAIWHVYLQHVVCSMSLWAQAQSDWKWQDKWEQRSLANVAPHCNSYQVDASNYKHPLLVLGCQSLSLRSRSVHCDGNHFKDRSWYKGWTQEACQMSSASDWFQRISNRLT